MVQRVRMKALNINGQYEQVHPQTTADQVVMDATTNQTLADKLADGTIGAVGAKSTVTSQVIIATTENQTVFPFDMSGMNVTKASLTVHLNGEFLHEDEYTLNTSQIVLVNGVSVGDKLHISINTGIVDQSSSSTSVVTDIVNSSGQTDIVGTLNSIKQESASAKQSVVQSLKNVDGSLTVTPNSSWSDIVSQIGNIDTGVNINGIVEQYKVQAGENISAGDFVEFIKELQKAESHNSTKFNHTNTQGVSSVVLNSKEVVISYADYSDAYTKIVKITVNNGTITVGSTIVVDTTNTAYTKLVKVSEDKLILLRRTNKGNAAGALYAMVIPIQNGVIMPAVNQISLGSSGDYFRAIYLKENTAFVAISEYGTGAKTTLRTLTVLSDGTISQGTTTVLETTTSGHLALTAIDENAVLVAHRTGGSPWYTKVTKVIINDSSISIGSHTSVGAETYEPTITVLDPTRAVMAYPNGSNSYYTTAALLDISGTAPVILQSLLVLSANTQDVSSIKLSDNHVGLLIEQIWKGVIFVVLEVSSTTLKVVSEGYTAIDIVNKQLAYLQSVTLNDSEIMSIYSITPEDGANILAGEVTLIKLTGSSIKKSTSKQTIHGVAQSSGTVGQTIPVITI